MQICSSGVVDVVSCDTTATPPPHRARVHQKAKFAFLLKTHSWSQLSPRLSGCCWEKLLHIATHGIRPTRAPSSPSCSDTSECKLKLQNWIFGSNLQCTAWICAWSSDTESVHTNYVSVFPTLHRTLLAGLHIRSVEEVRFPNIAVA